MTVKTPIRTVFDGSNNATGLAEFQSGEFIGLTHGGLGASLSIGTTGQVLKVNSGGTALEFGNVEAIVNIDVATDLTGSTLAAGDQILLSDGGTEGRVTLSQIDTLFAGTTQTLTNKTFDANGTGNSISNIEVADFASGAIDTDISSVSASDDTLASAKAIKTYVDSQVSASDLDFQGDSGGALSIDLDSESLTIAGGTGISTSGATNTLTVTLDDTAVSAGSYGSSTAIPVITVDAQGRLTSASTASISSTMDIAGDSGTDSIVVGTDTFTIAGGTGLSSTATTDTITLNIDSTVATLTGSQTLTNKTITSPNVSGLAITDSSIVFEGSTDDTNETTLTATDPTADRTITLPNASGGVPVFATAPTSAITDGTDGQALTTDGSGNLSFSTIAANFPQSTLVVAPGSEGDFDMSFDPTQTTQETPFETVGTDAFGIVLSSVVFSAMDPSGETNTLDLGSVA